MEGVSYLVRCSHENHQNRCEKREWPFLVWLTLWLFNIAMENGPFIDEFPIKTSIYQGFSMAMLNNQMVCSHWIILLHRWSGHRVGVLCNADQCRLFLCWLDPQSFRVSTMTFNWLVVASGRTRRLVISCVFCVKWVRWGVGGWGGMLTFIGLAHLRDATLLHVLFNLHNYVMLRYCTFSSIYTTTWCYVHWGGGVGGWVDGWVGGGC